MEISNAYEELIREKEELVTRAGALRPDGFTEFVQLADKAYSLKNMNIAEAEKLRERAAHMLPQVKSALENAISMRDRIKAIMIEHAGEAMERYSDALKDLAK